jgi:hypothetical protein
MAMRQLEIAPRFTRERAVREMRGMSPATPGARNCAKLRQREMTPHRHRAGAPALIDF